MRVGNIAWAYHLSSDWTISKGTVTRTTGNLTELRLPSGCLVHTPHTFPTWEDAHTALMEHLSKALDRAAKLRPPEDLPTWDGWTLSYKEKTVNVYRIGDVWVLGSFHRGLDLVVGHWNESEAKRVAENKFKTYVDGGGR